MNRNRCKTECVRDASCEKLAVDLASEHFLWPFRSARPRGSHSNPLRCFSPLSGYFCPPLSNLATAARHRFSRETLWAPLGVIKPEAGHARGQKTPLGGVRVCLCPSDGSSKCSLGKPKGEARGLRRGNKAGEHQRALLTPQDMASTDSTEQDYAKAIAFLEQNQTN